MRSPCSSSAGWLIRTDSQFHWLNEGYASFDDFLATLVVAQAQDDPQGARARRWTGSEIVHLTGGDDRARRIGTPSGPSTRTPARANGAGPI